MNENRRTFLGIVANLLWSVLWPWKTKAACALLAVGCESGCGVMLCAVAIPWRDGTQTLCLGFDDKGDSYYRVIDTPMMTGVTSVSLNEATGWNPCQLPMELGEYKVDARPPMTHFDDDGFSIVFGPDEAKIQAWG